MKPLDEFAIGVGSRGSAVPVVPCLRSAGLDGRRAAAGTHANRGRISCTEFAPVSRYLFGLTVVSSSLAIRQFLSNKFETKVKQIRW